MILSARLVFGLAAALAYGLLALQYQSSTPARARTLLGAAAVLHGTSILVSLLQRPVPFGFGPALSVVALLVVLVYIAESRLLPQLKARWALAWLGVATVLIALVFPGSAISTPAAGRNDALLVVHAALGMAAYALIACAVLHAWLMTRAMEKLRHPLSAEAQNTVDVPVLTLERLMFAFVLAGFVLLSITLLAGAFFGEQIYGSALPQRWSHKILFSVLAWCVLLVLLLGHWRLGWRGRKAVRVLYAAAAFLLLSYIGSHFVLEVLLQRMR